MQLSRRREPRGLRRGLERALLRVAEQLIAALHPLPGQLSAVRRELRRVGHELDRLAATAARPAASAPRGGSKRRRRARGT